MVVNIEDSRGIRSIDFPNSIITNATNISKIIDRFNRAEYVGALVFRQDRQSTHSQQVIAAEGFVKDNSLDKTSALQEKRARFNEVKAIVDQFEADEAARREDIDNKYIDRDRTRFPSGMPRPKERPVAATQSNSPNSGISAPNGIKLGVPELQYYSIQL